MVMSHAQKDPVDGSVETRPHSVEIDNRHLLFVAVTNQHWRITRRHRAWGRNPCLSATTPLKFMTFGCSTIKLQLLTVISVYPTKELICFYHPTERRRPRCREVHEILHLLVQT